MGDGAIGADDELGRDAAVRARQRAAATDDEPEPVLRRERKLAEQTLGARRPSLEDHVDQAGPHSDEASVNLLLRRGRLHRRNGAAQPFQRADNALSSA